MFIAHLICTLVLLTFIYTCIKLTHLLTTRLPFVIDVFIHIFIPLCFSYCIYYFMVCVNDKKYAEEVRCHKIIILHFWWPNCCFECLSFFLSCRILFCRTRGSFFILSFLFVWCNKEDAL